MTETATPSGRGESGLAWLAGGLAVLPLLQAVPWDFDFSAPLVVGAPALWFGRETFRRAVHRLGAEAARWRWLAAGVALLALLAAARSIHTAASIVALAAWTLAAAAGLLAGQLVREDRRHAHTLLGGLAAGAVLATVLHGVRWGLGAPPESAFYLHHRLMGLHLLGGALAATALAATAGRDALRWTVLGVIPWAGLLWTGSRSPLLGLACGVGWWWLRAGAETRRRLLRTGALHVAAGLALSAVLSAGRPHLGWLRVLQPPASGTAQEFTSNRSDFWRGALHHAGEAPGLGFGPDAYRFLEPKLEGAQPHNVFLQAMLDAGAPAALGLAVLAFLAVRRGARRLEGDEAAAAWQALAVASLVAGQLDGYFYHLLGLWPAALALGVCVGAASPGAARARDRLPGTSALGLAGAATIALLLHTWLTYQVALAPPPAPGSLVARTWRAFPSATQHLDRWIGAWERTSPPAALELARFGRERTPFGDYFQVQIAGLLLRAGDRAGAERELTSALAIAPATLRPVISGLRQQVAAPPAGTTK